MRLTLVGWWLILLVLGLLAPTALAQDAGSPTIVPPPEDGQEQLLFGEVQKMTALLRGNGEAVVLAKHVLNNPETDKDRTELTLTFNKKTAITNLKAYQLVLPPVCLAYEYPIEGEPPKCTQEGDPDYASDYFYSDRGQPTYYKLEPKIDDQTLTVALAKPIPAQKQGAVIFSFRTKDYAFERWGKLWAYRIVSLAADQELSEVVIGVDVDTDLLLKGSRSEVNYRTDFLAGQAELKGDRAAFSSQRFDSAVQAIGQGAVTKTAKFLAPGETLTARGSYATTWARLHVGAFGILGAILIFLGLLTRRSIRQKSAAKVALPPIWQAAWGGLLVAGLLLATIFLAQWLWANIPLYTLPGVSTLIFLLLILVDGALIIGPLVWFGLRYGWWNAFLLFASFLLWLMVVATILVLLSDRPVGPVPLPTAFPTFFSPYPASIEELG